LLVVLAFAVLYGCDQAGSPVEEQEEQGGVENTRESKGGAEETQGQTRQMGAEETQGQTRQEQEEELPPYDVATNQGCTEGGVTGRCLVVTTDATSRKDFRALTEHLRDENREAKAVVITFVPTDNPEGMNGLGAWFATERAAKAFLPEYPNREIRSIMDDGGFVVGGAVQRSAEETRTTTTPVPSTGPATTTGPPASSPSASPSPSPTASPSASPAP
jgi:hypothetical protein